jgi:hypothetical protein
MVSKDSNTSKSKSKSKSKGKAANSSDEHFVKFLEIVLKTQPTTTKDLLACDEQMKQGKNGVQRSLGVQMESEELQASGKPDVLSQQFNSMIRFDDSCDEELSVILRNVQAG